MSNTLKNVIIFSFGAAIGAATAWFCTKKVYSELADEEIKSVKETYERIAKRAADNSLRETEDNDECEEDENENVEDDTEPEDEPKDRPYVIEPDEYGAKGYDEVSLTYYEDGILADDMDNEIENIDELVGFDNLEKIGEYEDDAVHIRNDKLHTDYEILVDYREFDEIKRLNAYDKTEG